MVDSVNKRILYVEDDYFIGKMYGEYLASHNYDLTFESDGLKGLATARDGQFDLIMLDLMLPGLNGDEILKSLRDKEDLIPNSKVIVMTNYQLPEKERQKIENQVDAYLIKTDLMPSQLLKIVKRLIG